MNPPAVTAEEEAAVTEDTATAAEAEAADADGINKITDKICIHILFIPREISAGYLCYWLYHLFIKNIIFELLTCIKL